MAKRLNGEEIDDKIYAACVIACAVGDIDPTALMSVTRHKPHQTSQRRDELAPGVNVVNTVHFIPATEQQYCWEQLIPDVTTFTRMHQACVSAGLIESDTPGQYALAACDWTEHGWEEDEYEWIQGEWCSLNPNEFGSYIVYDENQWEPFKIVDEDKHGHPILAVLRRKA